MFSSQQTVFPTLKVFLVLAIGVSVVTTARAVEVKGLEPDSRQVYKTIEDGNDLNLHIFYPDDHSPDDKRPVIVFFFGGGWNGGSATQFFPHCQYLADRGMVAMSADYRVKKSHGTTPIECVMDGKSAVRWIREHASELGVDPEKVVAGGGSAGGQVAAATGTLEKFNDPADPDISCVPEALVLFNPVIDNSAEGYGYERVAKYWEDFSPMHNIDEQSPPTVIFLGTKDKLIPVSTVEEYKSLMGETGGRCDIYLYEGEPHGFFNVSKKENYESTVRQMDEFLESLGFLEGEPTIIINHF